MFISCSIPLRQLQIAVIIISMLLFARNRATNAFQIIIGMFLASTGASRRVIDTFNHMALSVSYVYVRNTPSNGIKLSSRAALYNGV